MSATLMEFASSLINVGSRKPESTKIEIPNIQLVKKPHFKIKTLYNSKGLFIHVDPEAIKIKSEANNKYYIPTIIVRGQHDKEVMYFEAVHIKGPANLICDLNSPIAKVALFTHSEVDVQYHVDFPNVKSKSKLLMC